MKRAYLKSALIIAATLLIGASAFAGDLSLSVILGGSLYGTDSFKLNNQNQKDADLMQASYSEDKAGASFRIYTAAKENDAVSFRSLNIWVKPVSMLKIGLGAVGSYLYTEQLNWWMVTAAESYTNAGNWNNRWASVAGVEGDGLILDLTPAEGLYLSAGITPGYGNSLFDADAYGADTKYGFVAKYNIAGFGSAGASFRDCGLGGKKIVKVGFDTNAVPGLYAFEQVVMNLDTDADGAISGLGGVAFDTYAAYSSGKFSVKATIPVIIRLTDVVGDSSYMTWDVKAAYSLDGGVSPFLRIKQNGDGCPLGTTFDAFTFEPSILAGADYSIGKASIWTAFRYDLSGNTWSLPFEIRVSW